MTNEQSNEPARAGGIPIAPREASERGVTSEIMCSSLREQATVDLQHAHVVTLYLGREYSEDGFAALSPAKQALVSLTNAIPQVRKPHLGLVECRPLAGSLDCSLERSYIETSPIQNVLQLNYVVGLSDSVPVGFVNADVFTTGGAVLCEAARSTITRAPR